MTGALLGLAAILVAAGLYQLTPAKQACLRHCRGPIRFLMGRWRPGRWGAFRMGAEHGAYCLGCCCALMTLLFFGDVVAAAGAKGARVRPIEHLLAEALRLPALSCGSSPPGPSSCSARHGTT